MKPGLCLGGVLHTEVLDNLKGSDAESTTRDLLAGSGAETQNLIDGNTISSGSGDEGGTVVELGHAAVTFHTDP